MSNNQYTIDSPFDLLEVGSRYRRLYSAVRKRNTYMLENGGEVINTVGDMIDALVSGALTNREYHYNSKIYCADLDHYVRAIHREGLGNRLVEKITVDSPIICVVDAPIQTMGRISIKEILEHYHNGTFDRCYNIGPKKRNKTIDALAKLGFIDSERGE